MANQYAVVVDDTSGTIYVGEALPGALTSAAVWRIKRIVESGTPTDTVVTWADGNSLMDNVWDDRAALSYS